MPTTATQITIIAGRLMGGRTSIVHCLGCHHAASRYQGSVGRSLRRRSLQPRQARNTNQNKIDQVIRAGGSVADMGQLGYLGGPRLSKNGMVRVGHCRLKVPLRYGLTSSSSAAGASGRRLARRAACRVGGRMACKRHAASDRPLQRAVGRRRLTAPLAAGLHATQRPPRPYRQKSCRRTGMVER